MTAIGNAMRRAVGIRGRIAAGRASAVWIAGALLVAGAHHADAVELGSSGQPSALIEEISASVDGLEEMDYVRPGRVIALGPQRRLVLDYLSSCTREIVSGGTVTIGDRASEVAGGRVERQQVPCAGDSLKLAAYQADVGGVTTMRGLTASPQTGNRLIVGGTSPILLLSRPGPIQIERFDVPAAPIMLPNRAARRVDVAAGRSARYMLDLATENIRLAPSGIYRATQGSHKVDFTIAGNAVDGKAPLMARLLPL